MVWVTAGLPLKDQAGRLEDEKVEDRQIDVELVLFLVFHAPGQVEIAVSGVVRVLMMKGCHIFFCSRLPCRADL